MTPETAELVVLLDGLDVRGKRRPAPWACARLTFLPPGSESGVEGEPFRMIAPIEADELRGLPGALDRLAQRSPAGRVRRIERLTLAREVARFGAAVTTTHLRKLKVLLASRFPNDRERSFYASIELLLRKLPIQMRAQIASLGVFQRGGHFAQLARA